MILADLLIILSASAACGLTYHLLVLSQSGDLVRFLASAAVVAALFVPLMRQKGLYQPTALIDVKLQVRNVLWFWTLVLLFLSSVVFALQIGKEFSRGATLSFACVGLVGLVALRFLCRTFIACALANGDFRGRNILLLREEGAPGSPRFTAELERHGFQVERELIVPRGESCHASMISDILSITRRTRIEEIFVIAEWRKRASIFALMEALQGIPLPVNLLPDEETGHMVRRSWHNIGSAVAIEFQRAPLTTAEQAIKRAADIICASIGLVVLCPLLAVTALTIKLDSPGPIFFQQRRHGFNGVPFRIFKFRTMSVLDDGETVLQATRSDPRVTAVGYWLRRTSIDELPQLINVLRGEMSIVGPRPHALAHDNYFDKVISHYAFRHHVKPGITGWAQVNGCRGETPTVHAMERRVGLDLWYVNNWSLWLDIRVMLHTVFQVIGGRNAY
jgi:Undecaprenyl-phosphate glucose phosphotransferase